MVDEKLTGEYLYNQQEKHYCLYKRDSGELLFNIVVNGDYEGGLSNSSCYSYMEWDDGAGVGHVIYPNNIIYIKPKTPENLIWFQEHYGEYLI